MQCCIDPYAMLHSSDPVIDYLKEKRVEMLLEKLHFSKLRHKANREHHFWQEASPSRTDTK